MVCQVMKFGAVVSGGKHIARMWSDGLRAMVYCIAGSAGWEHEKPRLQYLISLYGEELSINVSGWDLMINLCFLGAACVRVANELGRGDAKAVSGSGSWSTKLSCDYKRKLLGMLEKLEESEKQLLRMNSLRSALH